MGDLDIPAYLFQQIDKGPARSRAAMVWVHGGVHGNWGLTMFPFVKEAVERGYVVIAPDYRGSIGYGEAYHKEIDYGGYEVDDVISAAGYLASLPHVDPARIGIMGWSHGGYITLLSIFREKHPFAAGAAIVPITNLIFRLSLKGQSYQWDFATQKRIQGLPFEKPDVYIARSPLYHVDKLQGELEHVRTICGYCGVGCGIDYAAKDGKILYAQGFPEAVVNGEFLCVKGRFGWDFVGNPERLTRPLVRRDLAHRLGLIDEPFSLPEESVFTSRIGVENFVPVDWETAVDIVAGELLATVEAHGPDAVAGLTSARCTNEDNYLFQKLMRVGIGTNNIDHCARL